MYKKILVPLDGSKRAEAILPHVKNLALCFKAKVIFFIVIEPRHFIEHDEISYTSTYEEKCDHQIKETESYLASLLEQFREEGIKVQTLIGDGPVVKAILDAAKSESADLLAMASHGRSGLSRTFYGSISAGVLQRIDRPLLLIRSRNGE
jgi:nucleotide-binding universal stress UspA family protein